MKDNGITTPEEIDKIYNQFVKVVKERMDEYEGNDSGVKLGLHFYQVLNTTAHEKKYSLVRHDRRFLDVTNLLEKMLSNYTPQVGYQSMNGLVEDFCNKGCCEAEGLITLRNFKDKVLKKLTAVLPKELEALPGFFEKIVEAVSTISQNPNYYDWQGSLATELIDDLVRFSGLKEFLTDGKEES